MDEIKKEETSQEARIEKAEETIEENHQEVIEQKKPVELEEKYPDDNGCPFFNNCKKINLDKGVNDTCLHPIYFLNKLEKHCTQLTWIPPEPKDKKKTEVGEEKKDIVREQIKEEIMKDNKKTFTVVDIIKQEVARGNKDEGLIFQSLKTMFPNEKDGDLRKRIKPTIRYLEAKASK